MKTVWIELPVATRDGIFLARYSGKGLAELDFPNAGGLVAPNRRAVNPKPVPRQMLRWHQITTDALKKILCGQKPKELPPFDWMGKTEFQKAVWRALLKIPAGKTKSYGDIAEQVDKPKAVRAVGGACGANPIPVLVPCHRVIAANHKIGGFGSGLEWKRKLLAAEGVEI